MDAVGQITAINGAADANTTATANGSASSQAQFEQSLMQMGAALGSFLIMPMINKLMQPPGEGD